MRTYLYRFVVPIDNRWHDIYLTPGAAILSVANADENCSIEFWAVTDPNDTRHRRFQVFETGHPLPEESQYIGTAPRTHAGLVWHLVELPIDG